MEYNKENSDRKIHVSKVEPIGVRDRQNRLADRNSDISKLKAMIDSQNELINALREQVSSVGGQHHSVYNKTDEELNERFIEAINLEVSAVKKQYEQKIHDMHVEFDSVIDGYKKQIAALELEISKLSSIEELKDNIKNYVLESKRLYKQGKDGGAKSDRPELDNIIVDPTDDGKIEKLTAHIDIKDIKLDSKMSDKVGKLKDLFNKE